MFTKLHNRRIPNGQVGVGPVEFKHYNYTQTNLTLGHRH